MQRPVRGVFVLGAKGVDLAFASLPFPSLPPPAISLVFLPPVTAASPPNAVVSRVHHQGAPWSCTLRAHSLTDVCEFTLNHVT